MKKLFNTTFLMCLLVIFIFALTACMDHEPKHRHQYTVHIVQANCTNAGYVEEICDCGHCYILYELEATGHTFKNKKCTVCGKEQELSKGFEYRLSEDGTYYSIVGIGTCEDIYLYIPNTHENLPVKCIETHAFFNVPVKSIIFEENSVFTTLEENAITGSVGLEEVILPDSLVTIGSLAFQSCTELTSIHIPSEVSLIGDRAFFNCESLKHITVSNNNAYYKAIDDVLYSKDGTDLVQYALAKDNKTFNIPSGVTYISSGAFSSCENIVEVNMPDTLWCVSSEAFRWCSNLEKVHLSQNNELISSFAFDGCTKLKTIEIPESTTYINNNAFRCCSSLEYVYVDSNNRNYQSIDGSLYSKDGSALIHYALGKTDESFTIPSTVNIVADNAFYGCETLKEVIMGDNITYVGETAFRECIKLETVVLSKNLKTIKDGTFYGCPLLLNITLPESIEEIESWAFTHCKTLKSITIPSRCTKIGFAAFNSCEGLSNVIFENVDNWVVYESNGYINGFGVKDSMLLDPNKSIELLTSSYSNYYWRNE